MVMWLGRVMWRKFVLCKKWVEFRVDGALMNYLVDLSPRRVVITAQLVDIVVSRRDEFNPEDGGLMIQVMNWDSGDFGGG